MADDEEYLISNSDNNDLYTSEEMDVDAVFEKISPFGRFQILLQILIFFLIATVSFQEFLLYFIGYNPPWTCIARNSSDFCNSTYGEIFQSHSLNFTRRCRLKRNEWKYTVQNDASFVTEFDLVCDKSTMASIAGAIFFVGGAIGGTFGGVLADHYGRKRFLVLSLLISVGASVATSYVSAVWQLIVMRLLNGIIVTICIDLAWILMSEFVPTRLRPIAANICLIAMLLSNLLIDFVAYNIHGWRLFQRYTQLPSLFFILFAFWVPESPRWLLSVGKKEKCKAILLWVAKTNKKMLSAFHLKAPEVNGNEKVTYMDMLRAPKVRTIMLVHAVIGQTMTLTLMTSVLFMSDLGGNIYENFAIVIAVSIPAYCIAAPLLYRFGRKKTTLIPLFLSGFLSGIIGLLLLLKHDNSSQSLVAINVASKCFGTIALSGYIVWFFEQYPTVVRVRGLAFGGFMARLGQSGAPFFTTTLANINIVLPFFVMFAMTTFASFLGLFIGETKDRSTPESFDDLLNSESDYATPVVISNEEEDDMVVES